MQYRIRHVPTHQDFWIERKEHWWSSWGFVTSRGYDEKQESVDRAFKLAKEYVQLLEGIDDRVS